MLTFDYARPSTVAEAIGILHGQDRRGRQQRNPPARRRDDGDVPAG